MIKPSLADQEDPNFWTPLPTRECSIPKVEGGQAGGDAAMAGEQSPSDPVNLANRGAVEESLLVVLLLRGQTLCRVQ